MVKELNCPQQGVFYIEHAVAMQVVRALDFKQVSYIFVPDTQEDGNDARAVRQPWSEKNQFLVILVIFITHAFVDSTDNFYPYPVSKKGDLVDAATLLFPHISNSSSLNLESRHTIQGRPDIQSFAFDLGGSTCACTLQWDKQQYWQRVWYGMKYVYGHAYTALYGVILLQRWQWVVLYKIFNEIVEELATGVFGVWATFNQVQDLEPRYDTIVNDLTLAGIPFTALGCHIVYVIGLADPFGETLSYNLRSTKTVCLLFFYYFVQNSINGFWGKFGNQEIRISGLNIHAGKLATTILQLSFLCLTWTMRALPMRQFYMISSCALLMSCPFIFTFGNEPVNEQIDAFLAFSLTGIGVSVYQYYYTQKNKHILAFALATYASALVLFCSFAYSSYPPVAAPTEQFYYKRKWCGVGYGGNEDSCSWIRE